MRISELARRACLPVPTVKFYLRERLLSPGTLTARNQARYDECHLQRLRLIRALTTVGGLEIGAVRELLAALDDPEVSLTGVYEGIEKVQFPVLPQPVGFDGTDKARAEIGALADRLGWNEATTRSGRESLVQVLTALRSLGCDDDVDFFLPFALAAQTVVHAEMALVEGGDGPDRKASAMVRSILFDVLMSLLLRTARQHEVTVRLPGRPADT